MLVTAGLLMLNTSNNCFSCSWTWYNFVRVCGFTCQLPLFNLCPTATQQQVPQPPPWDIWIFAVCPRNSWCHTHHGSQVCRWFLCWTLWLHLVIFCHNGPRVGKSPLKSGTAPESPGKWCLKNLLFFICGLLQIFQLSFSQFWLSYTCISEMFMSTQTQTGLLGEHKFYCRNKWMILPVKNRAGPAHRDHCGVTGEIWGVSF